MNSLITIIHSQCRDKDQKMFGTSLWHLKNFYNAVMTCSDKKFGGADSELISFTHLQILISGFYWKKHQKQPPEVFCKKRCS